MTRKKRPTAEEKPPPIAADEIARTLEDVEASQHMRKPVEVKVRIMGENTGIESPHDDGAAWTVRLQRACGTKSPEFVTTLLNQIMRAHGNPAPHERQAIINFALAVISAAEPRNELEAALAAQMVASHLVAMRATGSAHRVDNMDQYEVYTAAATKAQRTFAAQMEALAKLRGSNARQTIVVEHRTQYIAPGGQGVMGDISQGGGGGPRTLPQPHGNGPENYDAAAVALAFAPSAPVAPMWGQDAGGHALPSAGDHGEAALPDPRRVEPGGAEGTSERSLEARPVHERGEGAPEGTGAAREGLADTSRGLVSQ